MVNTRRRGPEYGPGPLLIGEGSWCRADPGGQTSGPEKSRVETALFMAKHLISRGKAAGGLRFAGCKILGQRADLVMQMSEYLLAVRMPDRDRPHASTDATECCLVQINGNCVHGARTRGSGQCTKHDRMVPLARLGYLCHGRAHARDAGLSPGPSRRQTQQLFTQVAAGVAQPCWCAARPQECVKPDKGTPILLLRGCAGGGNEDRVKGANPMSQPEANPGFQARRIVHAL